MKDVRELIRIGLSKIPADSRVARAVKCACDAYDRGLDLKAAHDAILADSRDLGMFQAPGNLGFVTVGLLYGEGDFSKSLRCAVNCGDDTDCTGATVGAILGIMYGADAIPKEWIDPIGQSIQTIAINAVNVYVPRTIGELTNRVANNALNASRVARNGYVDVYTIAKQEWNRAYRGNEPFGIDAEIKPNGDFKIQEVAQGKVDDSEVNWNPIADKVKRALLAAGNKSAVVKVNPYGNGITGNLGIARNACTSTNSVVANAVATSRVARNAEPIHKEWGRDIVASARINPAGRRSYEISIYTDGITSGYSSEDGGKGCITQAKQSLAVLEKKATALKQAVAWMEQNFPKL